VKSDGNLLLVSNYPSDVAYAWWLMEHFWCVLADEFARSGSKVFLAYPEVNNAPKAAIKERMEVVALDVFEGDQDAVAKFIKVNDIRVLYLTDRPFFSVAYLRMRRLGVEKIIVHDHTPGDRPAIGGVKGLLKALRNRLPAFTCDAQIAISPLMRKRSLENGRIPASKVYCVQNGIPDATLSEDRLAVRKRLGISEDTVVVISTGRAHPYKRPQFIMNAAASVLEHSTKDVVFLIVGDGPEFEALESLHAELKLADRCRLLGYRKDVASLLCASDIAVHAALGEGFSLSILEYMRAKLAVLVPNIPSVQQAIMPEESGLVYQWDRVEALSEDILRLVDDSALRLKLGKSASSEVREKYSLDMCTTQFKDALKVLD